MISREWKDNLYVPVTFEWKVAEVIGGYGSAIKSVADWQSNLLKLANVLAACVVVMWFVEKSGITTKAYKFIIALRTAIASFRKPLDAHVAIELAKSASGKLNHADKQSVVASMESAIDESGKIAHVPVNELRDMCKDEKLVSSGTKSEVQERLMDAIEEAVQNLSPSKPVRLKVSPAKPSKARSPRGATRCTFPTCAPNGAKCASQPLERIPSDEERRECFEWQAADGCGTVARVGVVEKRTRPKQVRGSMQRAVRPPVLSPALLAVELPTLSTAASATSALAPK